MRAVVTQQWDGGCIIWHVTVTDEQPESPDGVPVLIHSDGRVTRATDSPRNESLGTDDPAVAALLRAAGFRVNDGLGNRA